MTDMADRGSDFINDLGDAVRRNPVSTALIGMGLVWLFAGSKAGVGPEALLRRTGIPQPATEAFNTVRDGVTSTAISAVEAIRDAEIPGAETIRSNSKLVPISANFLHNVRGNLADLFDAQPLALGAVGLAIGAGIAASLPQTDLENSYLGETSEVVRNTATETAGEQVERAVTLASDLIGGTKQAQKEGYQR